MGPREKKKTPKKKESGKNKTGYRKNKTRSWEYSPGSWKENTLIQNPKIAQHEFTWHDDRSASRLKKRHIGFCLLLRESPKISDTCKIYFLKLHFFSQSRMKSIDLESHFFRRGI